MQYNEHDQPSLGQIAEDKAVRHIDVHFISDVFIPNCLYIDWFWTQLAKYPKISLLDSNSVRPDLC